MLWVVGACATPGVAPAAPPPEHIEVEDATLETDGVTVAVERGRVARSGAGSGEGAHATATATTGGPPLDVVAATTTWDLRAHTARFERDVVLTRGALRLTCDALDLTLSDSPSPTVLSATATGAVVVTRGAQTATASRAELDAQTGVLVLTGQPTLTDGPHTMAGDRIRFWVEEDRVACDACRVVVHGAVRQP